MSSPYTVITKGRGKNRREARVYRGIVEVQPSALLDDLDAIAKVKKGKKKKKTEKVIYNMSGNTKSGNRTVNPLAAPQSQPRVINVTTGVHVQP